MSPVLLVGAGIMVAAVVLGVVVGDRVVLVIIVIIPDIFVVVFAIGLTVVVVVGNVDVIKVVLGLAVVIFVISLVVVEGDVVVNVAIVEVIVDALSST